MPPFTNIPFLEAAPMPPKKLRGIDITNAHGHDITKNINALYTQSEKLNVCIIKGGIIAIAIAENTTTGV